ncbi:hypothetical protein HOG27_00730 [bacterium]|jgi:hypothetical protein|nr:hypothetical protein [bacterium]
MKAMQTKQGVEIVLDSFEIINSDDSIVWLDNEKELYNNFTSKILEILENKDLFDPTNETFNLSVNTKNVLLEEVIALPLTAFELMTQARQSRGTFE